MKLVNNLELATNRRAVVSNRIVVTPYYVRFPKVAVRAVQMLEDVWNLLASSAAIGSVPAFTLLLNGVRSFHREWHLYRSISSRKKEEGITST